MRKARKTYRKTCKKNRNGRKSRKGRRKCKYVGGGEDMKEDINGNMNKLKDLKDKIVQKSKSLVEKELSYDDLDTPDLYKDIDYFNELYVPIFEKVNAIYIKEQKLTNAEKITELEKTYKLKHDFNDIITELYNSLYIFNEVSSYKGFKKLDISDIKTYNGRKPSISNITSKTSTELKREYENQIMKDLNELKNDIIKICDEFLTSVESYNEKLHKDITENLHKFKIIYNRIKDTNLGDRYNNFNDIIIELIKKINEVNNKGVNNKGFTPINVSDITLHNNITYEQYKKKKKIFEVLKKYKNINSEKNSTENISNFNKFISLCNIMKNYKLEYKLEYDEIDEFNGIVIEFIEKINKTGTKMDVSKITLYNGRTYANWKKEQNSRRRY